MKKIRNVIKPSMVRPIINKMVVRLAVGLIISLLWNRYFNTTGLLSVVEYAFFVVGACLIALAWFSYLKLDGVRIHYLNEENRKKRTKHKSKAMLDYADEKPAPEDELEPRDETVASLCASLLAGACFVLPSIVLILL